MDKMKIFRRLLFAIAILSFAGFTAWQVNRDVVQLVGGTAVIGKVGIDQSNPGVSNNITLTQNVFVSTLNQSTTQLASGATFPGGCESTLNVVLIQPNVFGDQGPYTVTVSQYPTASCTMATHTDSWTATGSATDPFGNYQVNATSSFYKVSVTNTGGGTTTTFRLDTFLTPMGNAGFSKGGTFGVASEASSAVGPPVQIGGRFETTPTTLTNGQQAVLQHDANQNLLTVINPTALAADGIVTVPSTTTESSHVLKASAGNLYGWCATTGGTAGFVMLFNATSAPGDGAVTPAEAPTQIAANSTVCRSFGPGPPEAYSTGITIVFSSTGPFTKTASATAAFDGRVK